MYTILLIAALFVLCVGMFNFTSAHWWNSAQLWLLGSFLTGVALAVCLVTIPCQRIEVSAHIQGHEELRTMDNLQSKFSDYELVAWRQSVAESNTSLAKAKYFARNPWTSVWYPKAVLTVEPIR